MTRDEMDKEIGGAFAERTELTKKADCLRFRLRTYGRAFSELAERPFDPAIRETAAKAPRPPGRLGRVGADARPDRRAQQAARSWGSAMTRGVPVLDPARDLAGATPENLAKALFRRTEPLRPGTRRKPVVGDEVTVEKVAPDESGHSVPHLRKRS